MDIGEVLSRAWQVIWKNKILWIFGILASCSGAGQNSGTGYRFAFQSFGRRMFGQDYFLERSLNLSSGQATLLVIFLVLVALVLATIVIILTTVGKIGLIQGTIQAERGEARLGFGKLFQESSKFFWRVLGLNILVAIVLALFILVIGVPFVIFTCGLGAFLLIPLVWLVTVLLEQGSIAIVVENLGVMDGVKHGWEVIRKNLGTMIVMTLILILGVGVIGGLIIALPILIILIPVIVGLVASISGNGQGSPLWIALIGGMCFLAYLPFLLVLEGILRSYIGSAWTLTYLRLTSKPVVYESVPNPTG